MLIVASFSLFDLSLPDIPDGAWVVSRSFSKTGRGYCGGLNTETGRVCIVVLVDIVVGKKVKKCLDCLVVELGCVTVVVSVVCVAVVVGGCVFTVVLCVVLVVGMTVVVLFVVVCGKYMLKF